MSEDQVQGFGDYHPEAAGYAPFNDAMAAWRNQVKSMQDSGALPPSEETPFDALQKAPEPVEDVPEESVPEETSQDVSDKAEAAENEAPKEVYNPADHTSPDVIYYLKICDYDEAVRVLESEEHGKNRKGILNLKQDILDQAWKTREQAADSAP